MITGSDLIKLGWQAGPAFGQALKRANQVLAGGGSREAALAAVGNPPEPPKTMSLRAEPLPLNEAMEHLSLTRKGITCARSANTWASCSGYR